VVSYDCMSREVEGCSESERFRELERKFNWLKGKILKRLRRILKESGGERVALAKVVCRKDEQVSKWLCFDVDEMWWIAYENGNGPAYETVDDRKLTACDSMKLVAEFLGDGGYLEVVGKAQAELGQSEEAQGMIVNYLCGPSNVDRFLGRIVGGMEEELAFLDGGLGRVARNC